MVMAGALILMAALIKVNGLKIEQKESENIYLILG